MPERPPFQRPPWADGDWLREVTGWVTRQLSARGLRITGPMAPRERPWSTVLEVPTSAGRAWFKTTAPSMANDARLTALLGTLSRDLILAPISVDAGRGWMLLPDGGQRLRDAMDPARRVAVWERLLPRYAELQIASARQPTVLLDAGALERRPVRLIAGLAALLDEPVWLRIGEPVGLSEGQTAALRALAPRLHSASKTLSEAGIPDAIQHDDLHDGNVLLGADGVARIVDWGDAGLSHPFATLLVTLRSVESTLGQEGWNPFGPMSPELAHLRDAYLEPWTTHAPRTELLELLPLATWIGMIGRVLTWRDALRYADDHQYEEHRDAVPGWLAELAASAPR